MRTYRLPDGTEAPAYTGDAPYNNHMWVNHPTLGVISVDCTTLTEVVPPLPPEPPVGSYATVEYRGQDEERDVREVWARDSQHWWQIGEYGRIGRDWEFLHARGKVTVLVPDPAADAPDLPWTWRDKDGDAVMVNESSCSEIAAVIGADQSYLTPDACRQLAGVLLRAARDHEQEASQ